MVPNENCLREVSDETRTRIILEACVRAYAKQTARAPEPQADARRALARIRLSGRTPSASEPISWRVGACQLALLLALLALSGASGCGSGATTYAETTYDAPDAPDNGCRFGDAPSANDSGICCPIDAPVYGPDGYCYGHSAPDDGCPSGWSSAVNAPDLCCPFFDGFVDAYGDCLTAIPQ